MVKTEDNTKNSALMLTRLVSTEYALLCITAILKFSLFYRRLGILYGYDAGEFTRTVQAYDFSGSLPALDAFFTSYHPPVSFFMAKFISILTGSNVIIGSQVLSFFSLLCSFLLLRGILRRIGLLHTVHGIVFLYLSASVPLFVRLATNSTYDSLVFFLGVATLYVSTELFWNPKSFSLRKSECKKNLVLLFLILTIGLLTKYSCVLHLAIPFIVLMVRSKPTHVLQHCVVVSLLCILAIGAVSPFYYHRYYKQTGDWMPMAMDWKIPKAGLSRIRAVRDKHKLAFTLHTLRMPLTHFTAISPIADSLPQEVWFEMWKPITPFQSGISKYMPDVYVHAFLPIFAFGFFLFFTRYRKRGNAVSDFGWILTVCAGIFLLSLLYFGYSYPIYQWLVFKAKYVPFVVLWITYLCALGMTSSFKKLEGTKFAALTSSAALWIVTAMIILNHTTPA